MAKKRKCEDEKTWRRRIAAWKRGGLSIGAFAEQEGLCRSTFLKWRKKLGGNAVAGTGSDGAKSAPTCRDESIPTLSFVELPSSGQPAAEAVIDYGVPFEVGLRSGRRLQVPASFDAEALTQLVAILEGR